MENMIIYNKLKQPPKDALKQIAAGRLKGKTDISPQWRFEAMTEQFGICGIGWKYEITRQWSEPGANDQIFCFTNINLYIKQNDKWSDAIPGTGGSMLVTKEQSGLHSSDEGYKMSLTDALSVSMKAIGMAADIYRGFFDGSKYNNAQSEPEKEKIMVNDKFENEPKKETIWLTAEQFDKAIKSNIKGIEATLAAYSKPGYGMKSDYRTKLVNQCSKLLDETGATELDLY